jgi:hypothetical protein
MTSVCTRMSQRLMSQLRIVINLSTGPVNVKNSTSLAKSKSLIADAPGLPLRIGHFTR